ncbi:hypothetical protein [Pseudaestuariivita atlantica]|uniref:Uncharacterized protein n=1 Tax=Pseudaestuariivita atlantica TaxID=1317121 RepID=A0A0L1JKB7_9RHOB|nr:hypothetical protein [Pseudaestuariivita atlantica]KNG92195.1 hypothetical protein ATO11_18600 [Pseudaestuariivita atlantica]
MITLLTFITCLATLVFLGIVAAALIRINEALESIGGTGESYLAKLRLGLRAIERETSHLPAAAPALNADLGAIAEGLTAVDATLGEVHSALVAQESGS